MQFSELRVLAQGLVLSASDVQQQLQSLADRFATEYTSVPAEFWHLQEAASAFRKLLETFYGAEDTSLRTLKQKRAVQGFSSELLLAERLFKQLNEIIQGVNGGQTHGPENFRTNEDGPFVGKELPIKALKTRWSFHKDQVDKLHKELRDNCSRCLGEMLLMNSSFSADIEPRPDLSSRSDTSCSMLLPNHSSQKEDKMLRDERPNALQRASSVYSSKYLGETDNFKMLIHDNEPKAPSRAPRTSTRMQLAGNTRRGDDVALMLSGIAASVTSSSWMNERTPRYRPRRVAEATECYNQGFCSCGCHTSGQSPSIWAISTFRSALGVISLDFRGQSDVACNDCSSTCRTRRKGRSMRFVYSFPTWLFHAAISASFTNTTGSPELILRVLHRIPTDAKSIFTGVFGMIARGDAECLKRALRTREVSVFDINGLNGTGVLWTCMAMNKFELLEILLFEGADLFQLDDQGIAPYSFLLNSLYTSPRIDVATRMRLETVLPMEQMLEACQLNELHKIVLGLRCNSVQEYMQDSSRSMEANSYDIRFRTPLGFASARGDLRAVRELLEAGALPDLAVPTRAKPKGPLASACANGHIAVVEELLMAGADVNARNSFQTPLHHLASSRNSLNIAACLLQHGADIHAEDKFHSTPLDLAAHHNDAVLADFLLRNGADPNHRDWEGSNALQIAISSNACATATVLLEHNADYRNVDANKNGVLHYLGNFGTLPMMEIMARHRMVDIDVNAHENQNQTPMQLCCARSGSTETLQQAFELLLASIARDSHQSTAVVQ